jgi:hypothetical protein
VAWPPAQYQGFFSGGINVGNVNLEFGYQAEDTPRDSSNPGVAQAWFAGLGLEPEPLATALRALDRLKFKHDKPSLYKAAQNGVEQTLWTTVGLNDLSSDRLVVFLCEYNPALFQMLNPPSSDLEARRNYLQRELLSNLGGPLGVLGVREIVLGLSDYEREAAMWRKLLNAEPGKGGEWKPDAGPVIRFVPSNKTAIEAIVIRVVSLARAREYLQTARLIGEAHGTSISFDRKKVMGIEISLTE